MGRHTGAQTISNRVEAAPYVAERFVQTFADEGSCLEWLRNYMFPAGIVCPNDACRRYGLVTKHHRVLSRRSYCCAHCGHHVHPTAGTIFHKSATPLRLWFYAIYLTASTDGRIPAREIQRQLGVTYKTAWRMSRQIRAIFDAPRHPDERRLGVGHAIATFVAAHEAGTPASG